MIDTTTWENPATREAEPDWNLPAMIRRRAGSPLVQTFSLVLVFLGCAAYSQWGIVALGSFMAAASVPDAADHAAGSSSEV